jgi:para-aminobenzoate synthetase/4-amino-4-deoxychorismate lyase
MGAFGPDGEIDLNVAIRTLVHDHNSKQLRMGVGSGLVHDSRASSEYAECLLKASFATAPAFDLLETLRWEDGKGFYFLDDHLLRLAASARYFERTMDKEAVHAALDQHVTQLTGAHRVRLRVDAQGLPHVESVPLSAPFGEMPDGRLIRLKVVSQRLDPTDPFVRHKTTRRDFYDAALAEAKSAGGDEAVILNTHGLVADGSFLSLFISKKDVLLTSRPSDGALDGILKKNLKRHVTYTLQETALTLSDFHNAEAIFAGNSVRGLMPAVLT